MKKLAMLAGLSGLFAVSALAAGTSSSAAATVTLTINPYLSITAGTLNLTGSGSYDSNGNTVLSGSTTYTVAANEAWTAAITGTTGLVNGGGLTFGTPAIDTAAGGTGSTTGTLSLSGTANLTAGTANALTEGTITITVSGA